MPSSTRDNTKRPRPKQTGSLVGVRLQPEDLAALDAWIAKEPDPPSRPEAIRAMMRAALLMMGSDDGERRSTAKPDRREALRVGGRRKGEE